MNKVKLFFLLGVSLNALFPIWADVKGTNGKIEFDSNSDGQIQMTLNTNGLGIGGVPSSTLHVSGNSVISETLSVGSNDTSANLNLSGSMGFNVQTISSSMALSDSSYVLVDSSSDNVTLTLPYAGNATGRTYFIKKITTTNSVWVKTTSELVDDTNALEMVGSNSDLPALGLISNGTNWNIINSLHLSNSVAADNLVGWWRLDETSGNTAVDSSGLSNDGSLIGTISFETDGMSAAIVNGLHFDTTGETLMVNNHESLRGMTELTLSVWINIDSKNDWAKMIDLSHNTVGNTDQVYRLWLDNSADQKFWSRVWTDDVDSNAVTSDLAAPTGEWVHLLTRYTGNEYEMFVNGNLQADVESASGNVQDYSAADHDLFIGAGANELNGITGTLDDVRIYNRALTTDEISALYFTGP